ncbi:hypothetical protein [Rubrivirga marina]|uniref:Phospholipase A2 domain-containing protein n=1 Tax=Rubrivirga marina TaxID=1196024 RepID=A0A271J0Q8_9BACT|nr:hypothetical protein [Rubrivirga marina]PAP77082.1 hypothetical protein BSZ37_11915 [Rubrivirga marina]
MTHRLDRFARALGASEQSVTRALPGVLGAWLSLTPEPAVAAPALTCEPVPADGHCPPTRLKQGKPGNVPTHNGCGAEGGSIPVPQGFGSAAFTPACNQHDHCYENCSMSQAECDDDFFGGMVHSCEQAYAGTLHTLTRGWCMNTAVAYWQAVAQGGAPAWAAAQVKACECCEGGGCGRESGRC